MALLNSPTFKIILLDFQQNMGDVSILKSLALEPRQSIFV